jgi:hypothetical protein
MSCMKRCRSTIAIRTATYGESHADVALAFVNKANAYGRLGGETNLREAVRLYDLANSVRYSARELLIASVDSIHFFIGIRERDLVG